LITVVVDFLSGGKLDLLPVRVLLKLHTDLLLVKGLGIASNFNGAVYCLIRFLLNLIRCPSYSSAT